MPRWELAGILFYVDQSGPNKARCESKQLAASLEEARTAACTWVEQSDPRKKKGTCLRLYRSGVKFLVDFKAEDLEFSGPANHRDLQKSYKQGCLEPPPSCIKEPTCRILVFVCALQTAATITYWPGAVVPSAAPAVRWAIPWRKCNDSGFALAR